MVKPKVRQRLVQTLPQSCHALTPCRPPTAVCWDYHVIFIELADVPLVWDLDTSLSFPCDASRYFAESFLFQSRMKPSFTPCVHAAVHASVCVCCVVLSSHPLCHVCTQTLALLSHMCSPVQVLPGCHCRQLRRQLRV